MLVAIAGSACGTPAQTRGDASNSFDAGSDALHDAGSTDASMDAWTDAPTDATIGPLTPDPSDPTSVPCTGVLGFPGPGSVPTDGSYGQTLVGDLDGDGKIDILNRGIQVVMARGNGDGTFQPPMPFAAPANAFSFRLVQLDSDGKPDLMFGVNVNSVFEIRAGFNDGNGGFETPQLLYSSTSIALSQLEVVDLNADGKQDIVGVRDSYGQVAVLISSGGSYAAPQLYAIGSGSYYFQYQVAVGDLTGDGYPDLVATNSNDQTVSVLLNGGDGTLATPVTYPAPGVTTGLVLADANEDGTLDVVVGTQSLSPNHGAISVLLNQGGGALGAAATYSVDVLSDAPHRLVAADVDGDGHIDIGSIDTVGGHLFLGSGTGQFAAPLFYPYWQATTIAFADLQADGRPDMLLFAAHGATAYLSDGTSNPFKARSVYGFGTASLTVTSPRMADVNGDEWLDLLAISADAPPTDRVLMRLSTGGGAFGPVSSYATLGPTRVVLADIDNNARPDLVLLGDGAPGHGIQTLLNKGDGTLTPVAPTPLPDSGSALELADIDGDGVRDAVIGHAAGSPSYAGNVRFYKGNGGGAFASGTSLWNGTYLGGFAVADFNGDGMRDVAIGSYSNAPRLDVFLAIGNGNFAPPIVTTPSDAPRSYIFARDIDADGDADLVGLEFGFVIVMLGDGTGTFGQPIRTAARVTGSDAAFADFDGDGHLDVAVTDNMHMSVTILLGQGNGTFQTPRYYDAGQPATQLAVGDVDGDGRVDILVNGRASGVGEASILFGRCL